MSGNLRDQRQVIPQSAGVVDTSGSMRGAREAGRAADMAGVLDPVGRIVEREAQQAAEARGREEGMGEELQRDDQGRLVPPDLSRSLFEGPAATQRRGVLMQRYVAELGNDAQGQVMALRVQHERDPAAFLAAANAYRAGTVDALPPVLRGAVSERMGALIQQHHGNLMQQRAVAERQDARGAAERELQLMSSDLHDLTVQGRDTTQARAAITERIASQTGVLWERGEAQQLIRQHTVLMPARAHLIQLLREGMPIGGNRTPVAPGEAAPSTAPAAAATGGAAASPAVERGAANLPATWAPAFARASAETGVPEDLLRAIAFVESSGRANAVSRVGAGGPMQLMPRTAADLGLTDQERFDPDKAIPAGARYMAQMLRQFRGDRRLALAAYNAGPGRVQEHLDNGRELPRETVAFLGKLMPGGGSGPNGSLATAEAGQMVNALLAGPGTPGWRPEWNGLTPDERQQLARVGNALVADTRQEITWREGRQNRAIAQETSTLLTRLAEIENQRREDGSMSVELRMERQQLQERIVRMSAIAGTATGAEVTRNIGQADRAAAQGESAAAVQRFRMEEAYAALGINPHSPGPPDEETGRLLQRISQLPLQAQASILEDRVRERNEQARVDARLNQRWAAFNDAMRPGEQQGPQVENNADNQAVAREWMRRSGVSDFTDPRALPMLVQSARAGVMPEQAVGFMVSAINGGDPRRFAAAAQLHAAMMAEPQARRVYQAQVDEKTRTALEGVGEQLASLPREGFEDRLRPIVEQARRVMRGDPSITAETLAGLGATPVLQQQALKALSDRALSDVGSTAAPARMREELNARILQLLPRTEDQNVAARTALRELMDSGRWGLSTYGRLPGGPAVPDTGRSVLGGWNANPWPIGRRGGEPQWVQHPPEQFTAPYGRGGTVGAEWQRDMVQNALRADGVPDAERARWRLGETAFLVATDRVERQMIPDGRGGEREAAVRLYEIRGPVGPGLFAAIGRVGPDGVRTAEPLLVGLEAEAARHRARWSNEARPRAEQARDRARARREDDTPPVEFPR